MTVVIVVDLANERLVAMECRSLPWADDGVKGIVAASS
jgi:hypothetical protein